MYAASPTAAEVPSDVSSAYCARVEVGFRAYGYALTPDAINLHFPSHPTEVCSHPGCYSSGNRRGQQFGPCLRLTKR